VVERELDTNLSQLGPSHRVAFAASCCERVLPAYEAFSRAETWGDPRQLRETVDRVWRSVLEKRLGTEEAGRLVGRCEDQGHHLDDPFDSIFTAPAQSAAVAVIRAVECAVEGDAELAARVGNHALDAFETYVDASEGEGSVYDADVVTSSRFYQDELAHQREDLMILAGQPQLEAGLIVLLRKRSGAAGFASIF
jgi:uncharacterized protein YjaG (DUF416 family)